MATSRVPQTFPDRLEYYMDLFRPSQSQLRRCLRAFLQELQCGLECHAANPYTFRPTECSLMMLDCCIDTIPTGKEKGVYYAIDFGGTNLRAIRCTLDGAGTATVKALSRNLREAHVSEALPKGLLDKRATATKLFDEIAIAVKDLVTQEGDKGSKENGVGLTFSFGMNQKAINSGILTAWTKGFETGLETSDPVVGQDVCALLDMAFGRQKLNAKTVAVLNDTVGAMLAGSYAKAPEMPPCTVGIILGTGVNGAYVQRDAEMYGYKGVVVNTELGGFNKQLPRNEIDYEVDYLSTIRGRQLFEKMVSGLYMPELSRLLILRIFQEQAPEMAWVPFSLPGDACGAIFNDKAPFTQTATIFETVWSWKIDDTETKAVLHRIVSAVFRRSAAIAAVAIAGMAMATGRLQPAMGGVTVGLDGTVYVRNPPYQKMVREQLEEILDPETAKLIHCVIAEDGSGKGAAILAGAILSSQRRA